MAYDTVNRIICCTWLTCSRNLAHALDIKLDFKLGALQVKGTEHQMMALKQLQDNLRRSDQQVESLSRQLWMKKPQVCFAIKPTGGHLALVAGIASCSIVGLMLSTHVMKVPGRPCFDRLVYYHYDIAGLEDYCILPHCRCIRATRSPS